MKLTDNNRTDAYLLVKEKQGEYQSIEIARNKRKIKECRRGNTEKLRSSGVETEHCNVKRDEKAD